MLAILLLMSLVAQGSVCEEARERFEACVPVPGVADRVAQCEQEPETVALYEACLPASGCEGFLACLEAEVGRAVAAEREKRAPRLGELDRAGQCDAHVAEGLQAVAVQVVVLSESRSIDEKSDARDCVLDGDWKACLRPEEQAEVHRYAQQRKIDCLAWEEPLAACILGLPGRQGCDPDSYPFWRLPLERGPARDGIVWTAEVGDVGWDARLLWVGDVVVVGGEGAVEGFRAGQRVWRHEDGLEGLVTVDGLVAGRRGGEVRLLDGSTGALVASVVSGAEAHGVVDGELVVATDEGVVAVDAGRCRKRVKRCVGAPQGVKVDWLGVVTGGDGWLLVGNTEELVALRGGQVAGRFELGDVDEVIPVKGGLAVLDGSRVALLSTQACVEGGDCRVARGSGPVDSGLLAAAGDGVAYNDHGFVRETHWLGREGAWTRAIGGTGAVDADDVHVFTVSERDDDVAVVALGLSDGAPAWHVPLPAAKAYGETRAYGDVAVALSGSGLAVRVGGRLWVVRP